MSPLTAAALGVLVGIGAGYTLGRIKPAHRASDWANWQKYDQSIRKHSVRWWAVFVILSAENLTWIALHPVQARQAWKHRNDPPPPRSPAVRIRDTHTSTEESR